MTDLSKVKVLETTYTLKDAKSRQDFAALLGENTLAALKAAAWKDVDTEIAEGKTGLPTNAAVKAYVDAQIETIPEFDVVVVTELPTASKDTFHKIYLLKKVESGENKYAEYITIHDEAHTPKYYWEKLGDIEVNLDNYLQKSATVAGVAFGDDSAITDTELKNALGLGDLAYADTASGTVEGETITGVKATGTLTAGLTGALGAEIAAATIATKANYTPAGTVTGEAIKGGSIDVALDDTATSITDLTYGAYTPAGTVTLSQNNNGSFQPAGTNAASAVTITPSKASFVQSLTAGSVDAASFTEGAFTPASINADKFFNAGALPTKAADTWADGVVTKGTAVSAAIEGVVASVGTGSDAETLILTAAQKDDVLDYNATITMPTFSEGAFTQGSLPSIDVVQGFNGGSKAADTFSANKLPVVDDTAEAWVGYTAAEAAAQVFTGNKYAPAFAGTEEAQLKLTGAKYLKQSVNTTDTKFTPVAATLGFSGTMSEQLIPTAINYSKTTIGTLGASAALPAGGLDVGDIVVAAKDVTVSPDAD